MIEPRRLIVDYKRQRGFFESRENKIRLEFNEYVPHIDNKIFPQIAIATCNNSQKSND